MPRQDGAVTPRSVPTATDPASGPGAYRPGGVRVLAVAWWVLAAVLAGDLLLRGDLGAALLGLPVLAFSCAVVFGLFWHPAVLVDADGVELVNVARRVRLPWSTVETLDTRWALSLEAAGRRWTSWAAPASGRRVRPVQRRETPWAEPGAAGIAGSRAPGSSAGEAAVLVETYLQAWRDDPRRSTEPVQPTVRWNVVVLIPIAGTALLASGALLWLLLS